MWVKILNLREKITRFSRLLKNDPSTFDQDNVADRINRLKIPLNKYLSLGEGLVDEEEESHIEDELESYYYRTISKAPKPHDSSRSNSTRSITTNCNSLPHVKLPPIDLPTFSANGGLSSILMFH